MTSRLSARGWIARAACVVLLLLTVSGCTRSGVGESIATVIAADRTPIAQAQSGSGASTGFVPVPWATTLPDGVVQGIVDYVIDGDTFEIVVDGVSARYRLYHADTPETRPDVECGGPEATDFATTALWSSDTPGQVWIESVGQRDKYGRKLAYLWFTIGGEPYLLNYVLIDSGWAEDKDYGDAFNPYRSALSQAASFARSNNLGVWSACGGFGEPAT